MPFKQGDFFIKCTIIAFSCFLLYIHVSAVTPEVKGSYIPSRKVSSIDQPTQGDEYRQGFDFDIDSNGALCCVYYVKDANGRYAPRFKRGSTVEDLKSYSSQPWIQISGWRGGYYFPLLMGCSIAAGPQNGDVVILTKTPSLVWYAHQEIKERDWTWGFSHGAREREPETEWKNEKDSIDYASCVYGRTLESKDTHNNCGPFFRDNIWQFVGLHPEPGNVAFAPDGEYIGVAGTLTSFDFWNRPIDCVKFNWSTKPNMLVKFDTNFGRSSQRIYPAPLQTKIAMGRSGLTLICSLDTINSILLCRGFQGTGRAWDVPDSQLEYNFSDTKDYWWSMDMVMQNEAICPGGTWIALTKPTGTAIINSSTKKMILLDTVGGCSASVATGPDNEPYIVVVDIQGDAWLYYFIGNREGPDWLQNALRCKVQLKGIHTPLPSTKEVYASERPAGRCAIPVLVKCKKSPKNGKYFLHFVWYNRDSSGTKSLCYTWGHMPWWENRDVMIQNK